MKDCIQMRPGSGTLGLDSICPGPRFEFPAGRLENEDEKFEFGAQKRASRIFRYVYYYYDYYYYYNYCTSRIFINVIIRIFNIII